MAVTATGQRSSTPSTGRREGNFFWARLAPTPVNGAGSCSRLAQKPRGRLPRGPTDCLVPGSLRTAAYASRTTLGGVLPDRLRPLVQATADLAERFQNANHTLYLVGGSVRDAIVAGDAATDQPLDHDLDFTTDARPDAIEELVTGWADAVWTQGKRFGTIGCIRNGQRYEITTHRAEAYQPDSRIKPEVAASGIGSRTTCRAGISPSTPWPSRCPRWSWSTRSTARPTWPSTGCAPPSTPEVSFADDPLQ